MANSTGEDYFSNIKLATINGQYIQLTKPTNGFTSRILVIYRGEHSPSCTDFLNMLDKYRDEFAKIRVDIIAVSADSSEQLQQHLKELHVSYPIAFGLSVEQMYRLNLHVSVPKNLQETNHPFAEPALFVIDNSGQIILSDIANNPYTRPNLEQLLAGLVLLDQQ